MQTTEKNDVGIATLSSVSQNIGTTTKKTKHEHELMGYDAKK